MCSLCGATGRSAGRTPKANRQGPRPGRPLRTAAALLLPAVGPAARMDAFLDLVGRILLCDYDNPLIRDLRYLHEMPRGDPSLYRQRQHPDLRGQGVPQRARGQHLHRDGGLSRAARPAPADLRASVVRRPLPVSRRPSRPTRPGCSERWRTEPDLVFQELMYERARVIWAEEEEIDAADPQIVRLRCHGRAGRN